MFSDLRFAFRSLGKSPGFSATVIVTLALGIGACTTMFSIAQTVLLTPSTPDSERFVVLFESRLPDHPESPISASNFLDWQSMATSFETAFAVSGGPTNFIGDGEPLPVTCISETVGAGTSRRERLLLGRVFNEGDFQPGKQDVVVLSEDFWKRQFGGASDVLGRQVTLDDRRCTIVGVVRSPPGRRVRPDMTLPLVFTEAQLNNRGNRSLSAAFARLKPGVTIEAAQAELDSIAAHLADRHPESNKGWGVKVMRADEAGKRGVRAPLLAMLAAVLCVLLIACANVANLLLARAITRHRELSIRAAVGAGQGRLVWHLLSESLLLALGGGAAGVILAHWALDGFRALAPADVLRGHEFALDATMLGYALALSVGTGLVCGLAPALLSSRIQLAGALKQGARGGESRTRGRLRGAMVTLQVACAVVLLAGASLLIRSFEQLSRVDLGFVPERAAGMHLMLPVRRYPTSERCNQFVDTVLARLRELPGVEAAGASIQFPISGARALVGFAIEGRPEQPRADWPGCAYYTASPGYFHAAGMRLLQGRDFSVSDTAASPRVAIVNETLARRYFTNESPIGRRINIGRGDDAWREIVGVVADIKQNGLAQESSCQVYEPNAQGDIRGASFVIRYRGDPAAMFPMFKQQVYAVDPSQPIRSLRPMQQIVDSTIEMPRFMTQLLSLFAGVALSIAAIGVYGVLAYSVGARTVEIGIRMALGATVAHVRREVLAGGARLVGVGLVLGLAGSLALTRLIQGLLFKTSPYDPVALASVVGVLAFVALLACWLPARRATRVDPIVALRAE